MTPGLPECAAVWSETGGWRATPRGGRPDSPACSRNPIDRAAEPGRPLTNEALAAVSSPSLGPVSTSMARTIGCNWLWVGEVDIRMRPCGARRLVTRGGWVGGGDARGGRRGGHTDHTGRYHISAMVPVWQD